MSLFRVDIEGGKYTLVLEDDGRLHALRSGKPWIEDIGSGSKMFIAMAGELEQARASGRSIGEVRDRQVGVLRAAYVEAENAVIACDFAVDANGQFRKGVVEGIRRCALKLFGIVDEKYVMEGDSK